MRAAATLFLVLTLVPTWARAQGFIPHRPSEVGEIGGHELPDWIQAGSGSSTHLDRVCGQLVVQLTLSGEPAHNYLNISLANDTRQQAGVQLDSVMVRFSDGLVRHLNKLARGDLRVEPLAVASTTLMFPNKRDFHGQESLTVEAVLWRGPQRCSLETRFQRDPRLPESRTTVTRYSAIEAALTAGATFLHRGPIARLAPNVGATFDLHLAAFPSPAHGITFDMILREWGSDAGHRAAPGLTTGRIHLEGLTFLGGYAYRVRPGKRLMLSLEGAAGVGLFQVAQDSKAALTSDAVPTLLARARLLVPFGDGYYAGLLLSYTQFLSGHLGREGLSGGGPGAALVFGGGP